MTRKFVNKYVRSSGNQSTVMEHHFTRVLNDVHNVVTGLTLVIRASGILVGCYTIETHNIGQVEYSVQYNNIAEYIVFCYSHNLWDMPVDTVVWDNNKYSHKTRTLASFITI